MATEPTITTPDVRATLQAHYRVCSNVLANYSALTKPDVNLPDHNHCIRRLLPGAANSISKLPIASA